MLETPFFFYGSSITKLYFSELMHPAKQPGDIDVMLINLDKESLFKAFASAKDFSKDFLEYSDGQDD